MAAPHLHRRLLVKLSSELHMPIQGLSQAARLLQGRLSSTSRRRLRELDAAYGIVRHITEERSNYFCDKVSSELRRSSPQTSTAVPGPIMFDVSSCVDDRSSDSSAPASPRTTSSSVCSRASTVCDMGTVVDSSHDVGSQASVSQVSSQVQTHLDGNNSIIVAEPCSLVEAFHNSCAGLAHGLRPRVTELHDLFEHALTPCTPAVHSRLSTVSAGPTSTSLCVDSFFDDELSEAIHTINMDMLTRLETLRHLAREADEWADLVAGGPHSELNFDLAAASVFAVPSFSGDGDSDVDSISFNENIFLHQCRMVARCALFASDLPLITSAQDAVTDWAYASGLPALCAASLAQEVFGDLSTLHIATLID
eukprot:CAMPEP_0117551710 /NCGR_PEP_ID=MMETSP0784-20121206/49329_1 /TAXON_ID=39447 /ORGANISM="" /LENGTH=365 /DNA_ID=CAMNT_0005348753 /DNA_START=77 /DNA_END=1171 /DNA_ORIENTATION=+